MTFSGGGRRKANVVREDRMFATTVVKAGTEAAGAGDEKRLGRRDSQEPG